MTCFYLLSILVLISPINTDAYDPLCSPLRNPPTRDLKNTDLLVQPYTRIFRDNIEYYYTYCWKTVRPLKMECDIYKVNLKHYNLTQYEFCFNITLTGDDNAEGHRDFKLLSMHDMKYNSILLRSEEMQNDEVVNARYNIIRPVLNDGWSIREERIYPIGLRKSDSMYVNELYTSYDTNIDISSREACKGSERCQISIIGGGWSDNLKPPVYLNLTRVRYYTLQGDSLWNGFYAEGYDPITGDYTLLYVDKRGATMKIKTPGIEHLSTSRKKFFVSFLVEQRTSQFTTISCGNYSDGHAERKSRFNVPGEVELSNIWIDECDGSILLLAGKVECVGTECWEFIVTLIQEAKPIRMSKIKFHCVGDRKNLAIHVPMSKDAVIYGCETKDRKNSMKHKFHLRKAELR